MGEWVRLRPDPWTPGPGVGDGLLMNCAGRAALGERILGLIGSARRSLGVMSPDVDDPARRGRADRGTRPGACASGC